MASDKMLPDPRFRGLDKTFWANVRSISERLGYTRRGTHQVKVFTASDMVTAMHALDLDAGHMYDEAQSQLTALGLMLAAYFRYRADVLNTFVEPRLMDVERARATFDALRARFQSKLPIPKNKQSGDKAGPAYLTAIVNMLIEEHCQGRSFVHAPNVLTTFTRGGAPLRTLARRVDGCFPTTVNPVALWEIKEYYYTTSFGSRVADGVYETLLDGLELEELRESEGINVQHLLMIDARYTWWEKGRSYLCRIVDALHMGYVDEVLFGYEVVERLPAIVAEWIRDRA
jgi:hypothetical protein